jgi:hypothetical protein
MLKKKKKRRRRRGRRRWIEKLWSMGQVDFTLQAVWSR